jgi:hypothetical protein
VTKLEPSVEIIESYKDYEPSVNATVVTRKLIDNIPQKYLLGLGQIVITNQSGLPRRELRKKVRSRKRKLSMDIIRGFYHYRTASSPAWIEIFIDQILNLEFGFYQKIPFLREQAFAHVLYHEIGHHIHTVFEPEYREREDVADEWAAKLWWHYYVKKKYWYLLPFLRLLAKLYRSRVYRRFEGKVISDIVERQKKSEAQSASEKSG